MSANETTRFQVNFKLVDGTLINLYADNAAELESLLTSAQDYAMMINQTAQIMSGTASLASVSTPVRAEVKAPPAVASADGNNCKHGGMVYRSGEKGGKKWQGYFCPADRNASDKCDPVFIR
jgi:hypothetical protein